MKKAVCWKRGWQEINFRNSEHTIRIDTQLWFFFQRCWFCCADALHCCTLSATLFVVFMFSLIVATNMRTELCPCLEKHADDGHHRKSSVSDFGIKLFGLFSRVRRGQHLESKVSSIRSTSWGLFLGDLAESHVGQDLTPSCRVGILGLLKPTWISKATCYIVIVITVWVWR